MHPALKPFREILRPIKRAYQRSKLHTIRFRHPPTYSEDLLITHHICSFVDDPRFQKAYARGIQAVGRDNTMRWRTHVALWAAQHALHLEGDFVECGVNKGFLTSAILDFLNWNTLERTFYLFDTFCGLDFTQLSEEEIEAQMEAKSKAQYKECFEEVKENFAQYNRVHLVRGSVPDSLESVKIDSVAYLSLDMNCAAPEIAAAKAFWPKMCRGAIILLDDYGYGAYESTGEQKKAFDRFAQEKGVPLLALPTGQGLILKP